MCRENIVSMGCGAVLDFRRPLGLGAALPAVKGGHCVRVSTTTMKLWRTVSL